MPSCGVCQCVCHVRGSRENEQVECDHLTAVAMKQTLGRQVGEVREHECNMHVCVGVGSHWLKLLQTILLF